MLSTSEDRRSVSVLRTATVTNLPVHHTMATLGHNAWHMDDIDDALAADFDGSLSGLGIELGTASFNMSETLLALPSIKGITIGCNHFFRTCSHPAFV